MTDVNVSELVVISSGFDKLFVTTVAKGLTATGYQPGRIYMFALNFYLCFIHIYGIHRHDITAYLV